MAIIQLHSHHRVTSKSTIPACSMFHGKTIQIIQRLILFVFDVFRLVFDEILTYNRPPFLSTVFRRVFDWWVVVVENRRIPSKRVVESRRIYSSFLHNYFELESRKMKTTTETGECSHSSTPIASI